jgi:hypothetical protein
MTSSKHLQQIVTLLSKHNLNVNRNLASQTATASEQKNNLPPAFGRSPVMVFACTVAFADLCNLS